MYDFLSAVASVCVSPLNWVVILIFLYFLIRNRRVKRICKVSALIIFILFSNQWLLNAYARYWNPSPGVISSGKPYSCAIVLGGFGSPDDKGNGFFNIAADRFIQAVELYKKGKVTHILVSGGNGRDMKKEFSEGKWARGQMIIMGIPDSVIFYEDQSGNTAENALNSKQILDAAKLLPPYLLISSASHIPRASLIFRNQGMDVVGYPCNYLEDREGFSWKGILPKPENLFVWHVYLKETLGYLYYYLKGK